MTAVLYSDKKPDDGGAVLYDEKPDDGGAVLYDKKPDDGGAVPVATGDDSN